MEIRRQRNVIKQNPANLILKTILAALILFSETIQFVLSPTKHEVAKSCFLSVRDVLYPFPFKSGVFFYLDQKRSIYRRKLLQVTEYKTKRNPLIKNNSFLF